MTGLPSDRAVNRPYALAHPDDTSNTAMFAARFQHAHRHGVIARSSLSQADRSRLDAATLGLGEREYHEILSFFTSRVEGAVSELLSESGFSSDLRSLPFRRGDRVLALGDSITDDSCSWAEMLSAAFRLSGMGIEVVNHGISGGTTSGAIKRIDLVAAQRPDWVVLMLGTNDARRHGETGQVRMVSLEESMRNIRALRKLIKKDVGAQSVIMAPAPVLEERLLSWDPFVNQQISWRERDVAEFAHELIDRAPGVLDLHGAFAAGDVRALLTSDGVHPTVVGQQLIVRQFVSSF